MKKNLLLSLGLLINTLATAQVVNVNVIQKECKFVDDSLTIEMSLSGDVNDLNSRDAILLTPFLSTTNKNVDLSPIQLNGKYKHILYNRNKEIRSRMNKGDVETDKYIQSLNSNGKFSIDYAVTIAQKDWMSDMALQIRCDNLNADNEINEISNLFVQNIETPTTEDGVRVVAVAPVRPEPKSQPKSQPTERYDSAPSANQTVSQQNYKGSYVAPDSDATDERNQRDLNFSLEEAQVMVNVNPQILSLKELFTVAMSYKENREKFYHIISTCVKLYPTHPIANLNAASMAIELGDAAAANKYLQIAPYESLAYKNCRGAYELMNGNIYEGIRLLKSAKTEGSEEAGYNLELFFKLNK
ncbi:MAG: DUF3868 domain-containing protein [Rikenellaceae bacterium]